MSEAAARYQSPQEFFQMKEEPLPAGAVVLHKSNRLIQIENAFRDDCRAELEQYARGYGANALLDCELIRTGDEYGPLWRLQGRPAVVGIPDPAGATKEELMASYKEPPRPGEADARAQKREWRLFACVMISFAFAGILGFLWIAALGGSSSGLVW